MTAGKFTTALEEEALRLKFNWSDDNRLDSWISDPAIFNPLNAITAGDVNNGFQKEIRELYVENPEKFGITEDVLEFKAGRYENIKELAEAVGLAASDSAKHILFLALIAQDHGYDHAVNVVGFGHEQASPGKYGSHYMDLHNNIIGGKLGVAFPNATTEELKKMIANALMDDGKITIKGEEYKIITGTLTKADVNKILKKDGLSHKAVLQSEVPNGDYGRLNPDSDYLVSHTPPIEAAEIWKEHYTLSEEAQSLGWTPENTSELASELKTLGQATTMEAATKLALDLSQKNKPEIIQKFSKYAKKYEIIYMQYRNPHRQDQLHEIKNETQKEIDNLQSSNESSLLQSEESSLLTPEVQSLGWTDADIDRMVEAGREIGLDQSPQDIADSLNSTASIEHKSVEDIYALFKEGNGEQITEMYQTSGYISDDVASLSDISSKAGYNADHLVEQGKQYFDMMDEKNLNTAMGEAKNIIHQDSTEILNGGVRFEGFPVMDDAAKNEMIKTVEASGFNPEETMQVQGEIKHMDKLLSKADMSFQDVKASVEGGEDIKNIPALNARGSNYTNMVSKDYGRIDDMKSKLSDQYTAKIDGFKEEVSSIEVSKPDDDSVKQINSVSRSTNQAYLNLGIQSSTGTVKPATIQKAVSTQTKLIKAQSHLVNGSGVKQSLENGVKDMEGINPESMLSKSFSGNQKPHQAIKSVGTKTIMQQGQVLMNNPNMVANFNKVAIQSPQMTGCVQMTAMHPIGAVAQSLSPATQNIAQSASQGISL